MKKLLLTQRYLQTLRVLLSSFLTFVAVVPATFSQQVNNGCDKPSVLRITMAGNDAVYQLDNGPAHKKFSLGEVPNAVRACSPDKMIFVVTNPTVPLRFVWLPGKEQISRVRYFMQSPDGVVHELRIGPTYRQLPLTSDIVALPDEQDVPPHQTITPKSPK